MQNLDEFLSESKNWFEKLILTIKEHARKLKESEVWFSTTLNSIGDAVIATDRTGQIQFLNPIAEDLTGWSKEESVGKDLSEIFNIINEETRKPVENPVLRVIREGRVVGLANHTILINKNGKEIFISDSGAPIKNEKGEIIGVILVFRDVSIARKTEIANLLLANIVKSSDDAIFAKSLDGKVISWNDSAEKIYGYTEEEILNKPVLILAPDDKAKELEEILKKIKLGQNVTHFKTINKKKDGTLFNVSITVSPIKNKAGKIIAASTIARDISESEAIKRSLIEKEEKYRQAYKKANFYKDIFVHDINNLFQNIISSAKICRDELGNMDNLKIQEKMLKMIFNQVDRGANLVRNIQKLSKLDEIGKYLEPIDLTVVLNQCIGVIPRRIKDKQINIKVDTPNIPIFVMANELLIDIFDNLLNNAVKHNLN
ncbi:MAG: PAS domain S-box protein, partial [Candidatus Helarchaeota archaeon]